MQYVHLTCCSMSAFNGLTTMPIAFLPTQSGGRNMHNDFPEPVAIRTKTSWQCNTGKTASSCPGLKSLCLKCCCNAALVQHTAEQLLLPSSSQPLSQPPQISNSNSRHHVHYSAQVQYIYSQGAEEPKTRPLHREFVNATTST